MYLQNQNQVFRMIDIEMVNENFRRMTDVQITRFAKLEADKLSLEAFHALKDELELMMYNAIKGHLVP